MIAFAKPYMPPSYQAFEDEVRAECLASLLGHYPESEWTWRAIEFNVPQVCAKAVRAANHRQMMYGPGWAKRLSIARHTIHETR